MIPATLTAIAIVSLAFFVAAFVAWDRDLRDTRRKLMQLSSRVQRLEHASHVEEAKPDRISLDEGSMGMPYVETHPQRPGGPSYRGNYR